MSKVRYPELLDREPMEDLESWWQSFDRLMNKNGVDNVTDEELISTYRARQLGLRPEGAVAAICETRGIFSTGEPHA